MGTIEPMLKIILIRPGSTDFDEQGRITGTLDVPLNDCGNDQVARTIDELTDHEIQAIYTWRGKADVSALAGKPVRLRFVLKDADVYSLRFR